MPLKSIIIISRGTAVNNTIKLIQVKAKRARKNAITTKKKTSIKV